MKREKRQVRPAFGMMPARLCSEYCNALRAGGVEGPLCPFCDAVEALIVATLRAMPLDVQKARP